jgi:Sap-like sulfolipid-1-addressing protein
VELLELAVLAIASAFWPILIAVDLLALRTAQPVKLLSWFLAAALLTTITEGLVIVFVLEGTTLASSSHGSVGAWGNLIGGVVALLVAYALRARAARLRAERPAGAENGQEKTPWAERAIARGGVYAFGAGVVLNLFPGVFPFVALRNIAALGYGDAVKVLLVIAFYVCMFALVEVPLVGLLIAPDRIEPSVRRLNDWLDRNGRRLEIDVLAVVGLFLVVRGIVQLATT